MRVVVTGALGFVGARLSELCALAGDDVVRVARRTERGARGLGAFDERTDFRPILEGAEVVHHLAALAHRGPREAPPEAVYEAVNVGASLRLAEQALDAGVRRFVFVSTAGVLGPSSPPGRPLDDDAPPAPHNAYARSKRLAEQRLGELFEARGARERLAIVRPPLVYGPGVPANFLALARAVRDGWPLPFAGLENRRSLVGLDNLCAALRLAAAHPSAGGGTFLVTDGEAISTAEIVRRLARAFGRPARLFPAPLRLGRLAARALGRGRTFEQIFGDLWLEPRRARRELGFSPAVPMSEELARLAAWLRDRA